MDNPSRAWKKVRSVNSNSANFPTWVTSELALESDLYVDAGTAAGRVVNRLAVNGGSGLVPYYMHLMPYGLGSDNDVFSVRIVGVRRIGEHLADGRSQFMREILAVLSCTISGAVGVAGGQVLNTERFADAIAITNEGTYTANTTRAGTITLYNMTADTPAHVVLPLLNHEALEFEWDQTTNTPTMNALYSFSNLWG